MKIFKDKHTLQKEILKTKGISFVPTMGGLHKGHISLINQSKKFKINNVPFCLIDGGLQNPIVIEVIVPSA